jgi:hypothetical protein
VEMLQPAANDSFEFNLRLIDAVRKNPCLYDASDKQYRLSDHKIKIWNKLVQLLRFTGLFFFRIKITLEIIPLF